MIFYTVQIVIEKAPDDGEYAAYATSLPGCFSRGRTIEETQAAIRRALSVRLQELLERGEPLPEKRKFIHVEDVTIGLPGPDPDRPDQPGKTVLGSGEEDERT